MDSQALTQAVTLISTHGYWFLFFAMVIEGPIVTTAAAFASALGFFHVFVVFTLSILANIAADIIYYSIGYWGRLTLIEKYGKKFGFGGKKVKRIEKLLRKNPFATVSAIKMTPGLSTFGLIVVGASKLPFKKFIEMNLYIALPMALFFVVVGYYAGLANAVAEKYLHHSQYALILVVLAIIIGNYLYQKISKALAQRIEKI